MLRFAGRKNMEFERMPDHIGPLVKMLNTSIESYMNTIAASLGLTGTQTHILHYLCDHSGEKITIHALEGIFSLNHATLSGIISRLEEKGFVVTQVCPDDKRKKFIIPAARAFDCDAVMRSRIELCEKLISAGLGEEERQHVRELLIKMIKAVNGQEFIPAGKEEEEEC